MKTLLYALIAAASLVAFAPAQELIQKNDAQRIAEQIDNGQVMLLRGLEMQLNAFYRQVNTAGKQQAILDVFGNKAVAALNKYTKMRDTLLELNPNAKVPAPDLSVFKPNANGTVTYIAPPKP